MQTDVQSTAGGVGPIPNPAAIDAAIAAGASEPTRVITVRMPKSMHEKLKREAHSRQTSLNQLCVSSLQQTLPANEEANHDTDSTPGVPVATPDQIRSLPNTGA